MSFSNWQLVAILAILLAAIVCAQIFAPGAASTVVGMATTLFAALFVQRDRAKPDASEAPDLKVIDGGKP